LFGGRQPLCGIGVTSRIVRTSSPAVCKARLAESRPDPGPFTLTSRVRIPASRARFAAVSAACWAANGVPFREPLKPRDPALDQQTTLPSRSAMVTVVLLNVAWMCAMPVGTIFFSFFFAPFFLGWPAIDHSNYVFAVAFLRTAIAPRLGPLRVRALVCVRCPRTGSPRRCRSPRYAPISIRRLILYEISFRRSPSMRYCSSITFLILLTSSSLSSRTFLSALTPAALRILFDCGRPMPYIYVNPISILLFGGRSTPAIRAISTSDYPCRCLCLGLTQITRTTRLRWTILHLSQIFLTDALTFIKPTYSDTRSGPASDHRAKAL